MSAAGYLRARDNSSLNISVYPHATRTHTKTPESLIEQSIRSLGNALKFESWKLAAFLSSVFFLVSERNADIMKCQFTFSLQNCFGGNSSRTGIQQVPKGYLIDRETRETLLPRVLISAILAAMHDLM